MSFRAHNFFTIFSPLERSRGRRRRDAEIEWREKKERKKKDRLGARSRRVINRNHDFLGNIRNPRAIQ